jgi:AraC family transcriptional regulator
MPALTLIRTQPHRRVRLGEAAYACGLSATRFAVVFNQTVGLSFGRFALRARLAYVARRLLSANTSIERIASEAGFVDASHLHRTFVRHYGCTPGQYRERAEPKCSHGAASGRAAGRAAS